MWKKTVVDGKQDWPYSQFSEANGQVVLSGQTALKNGVLVPGGIQEQTRQAIDNSMSIVHRLGLSKRHIHDVQVILLNEEDRGGFEQVYEGELFPDPQERAPRTLIGARPANGSLVDIKMVLSRVAPHRGPPGEPEMFSADREVGFVFGEGQED